MLRSVELDSTYNRDLLISLPRDDLFEAIIRSVNDSTSDTMFVEQVSTVWLFLLWNTVISRFLSVYSGDDLDDAATLFKFAEAVDILPHNNLFQVMQNTLTFLHLRPPEYSQSQYIRYAKIGEATFFECVDVLNNVMEHNGLKGILLIDSLEAMKIDSIGMHPAFAGFLHAIQLFRTPGSRFDIRCCIPGEIYHPIKERISSNPMKDFAGSFVLHWNAKEILQMVAVRLILTLNLATQIGTDGILLMKNLINSRTSETFSHTFCQTEL